MSRIGIMLFAGTLLPLVTVLGQPPGNQERCPRTVVMSGCDTGVQALLPDGTCLQDAVDACLTLLQDCPGPSRFHKCLDTLVKDRVSGAEFGAISACAAKVQDEPKFDTCKLVYDPIAGDFPYDCVAPNADCRASTDTVKGGARKDWRERCDAKCQGKECIPKKEKCVRDAEPADAVIDVAIASDRYCLGAGMSKGCHAVAAGICQCKCVP